MQTPLTHSLRRLWAALFGEYWLFWTLHWQAGGPHSYGDHQLYERLYAERRAEIDRIAELLAAVGGPGLLDPAAGMEAGQALVAQAVAVPGTPATKALAAVQAVLGLTREAAEAARGTPWALPVENAVGGVADSHVTALYLLQQRAAGRPVHLPAPAPARAASSALGYLPRSSTGQSFARLAREHRGTATHVPDVGTALGAVGDLLSLVPGGEGAKTAGAVGKGLAVGVGLVAAWQAWRALGS